ncbi:MAG: signal peptidase I, partial [Acidobacteria bacterium]|nr:signal peptidase I [Acidobacteriota bacterium]
MHDELKPSQAQQPARQVTGWIRDFVISIAISAFIIVFLYQPVVVEGTSMLPRLEDQDRLFINKVAYRV